MSAVVNISEFLDAIGEESVLLIDARSEKEFDHAHIPGAINIPLLNNEHRHLVGMEYKKKGREAAVALGFKLVGPHFHRFIEDVKNLTDKKNVCLYCWRGGMRSGIMSWILSMAGFRVKLLKGGYKSFRNHILSQFSLRKKVMIVGGHTGSGKTEILKSLGVNGEQIIDLEALAHHRGSAFGALGMKPQPSTEQFENLLGLSWSKVDDAKTVWLEGESRMIGVVKIPDELFNQLQSAPVMEIISSDERRKKTIMSEYGKFSNDQLAECTSRLKKKLGGLRLTQALNALNENDYGAWLDLMFEYYDKNYSFSMQERTSKQRIPVTINDDEKFDEIAARMIALSRNKKEVTL